MSLFDIAVESLPFLNEGLAALAAAGLDDEGHAHLVSTSAPHASAWLAPLTLRLARLRRLRLKRLAFHPRRGCVRMCFAALARQGAACN